MPQHHTTGPAAIDLHEPLLRASDVAALLGIPRTSVYDYARRQHDPAPVARHRRFYRSAIGIWLASQV